MDAVTLAKVRNLETKTKQRLSFFEQTRKTKNYAAWDEGGRAGSFSCNGVNYPSSAFNTTPYSSYWEASDATYPQWIERKFLRDIRANRLRIAWEPGPSIPVISAHTVQDEEPVGTSYCTTASFSSLMDWLETNGYQPIFWSEAIPFMRGGELPAGITKPCIICFLGGGLAGVYGNAFPVLQAKGFKFNITASYTLMDADPKYITTAQYNLMLASGLFGMHLYDPDPANVVISPDGTEDRDFAFREYTPETGLYEDSADYEARMYDRFQSALSTLRTVFGQEHDVIVEVPSWAYNKQIIRILHRLGIACAYNTGVETVVRGRDLSIVQTTCPMSEWYGTVEAREANIASYTLSAPTKTYTYEVYVSTKDEPATGAGWESSTDWLKVVDERTASGVSIDPIYPRSGDFSDQRGDSIAFRTLRVKVLGEAGNSPAKIYDIQVYYEGNQDVDVDNVRLENLEGRKEIVTGNHLYLAAGKTTWPSGQANVTVNLPTAFVDEPKILITPIKAADASGWTGKTWWVKSCTHASFTLAISEALASTEYFYWVAIGNQSQAQSTSGD